MLGIRRARNRRKETQRRRWLPALDLRRIGVVLGVGGVLAVSIWACVWLLDQPVTSVAVRGRFQRVAAADVERAVRERVRGTGLVTVELSVVRRAIETVPWVDTATVERSWPRGLTVTVIEQVAAARWGANGLLNTRGELFVSEARHIPPELPRLSGPAGTEREVAQRYLAMAGRLVEAGLRLTAVRLDARGAWELDLNNGVEVRLGRRQVDERFERFMTAALKLAAQRASEISYLDMRYTNGFAVGWRAGPARVARGAKPAADNTGA